MTANEGPRKKLLQIRLSEEEEQLLSGAAQRENLPTGTWLRRLGLLEARRLEKKETNR